MLWPDEPPPLSKLPTRVWSTVDWGDRMFFQHGVVHRSSHVLEGRKSRPLAKSELACIWCQVNGRCILNLSFFGLVVWSERYRRIRVVIGGASGGKDWW